MKLKPLPVPDKSTENSGRRFRQIKPHTWVRVERKDIDLLTVVTEKYVGEKHGFQVLIDLDEFQQLDLFYRLRKHVTDIQMERIERANKVLAELWERRP